MLVHICCSVDSHYFLGKLRELYPDEKLTGFFYDPNIHPYSEYRLRLFDVERSCEMLGIELIEGEYDTRNWLEAVRGLEKEPERGARCAVCFDRRFEVSAQKAQELGMKSYTSTLLTSPKKSLTQLKRQGDKVAQQYGVEFVAPDFRKASGTQEQNELAKADKLYRQDYCGCLYGLSMQRDQQEKLADELMSPISGTILPESIEERLTLYERRYELEQQGKPYDIVKQRFLNYRLMMGWLRVRGQSVPAHFLPYSVIKGSYTRGRTEHTIGDITYMSRSEVRFITLDTYNRLMGTAYRDIAGLIYFPPPFEEEVRLRQQLEPLSYTLSAIIVVEELPGNKIELYCDSRVYEDVREVLVEL